MHQRLPYTVPITGGRTLDLGARTLVMAIVNVTPDSFAESSPSIDPARALDLAQAAQAQGADLIDLGAESTRPGSAGVEEEEELARLLPALRAIASRISLPVSVDTTKAGVARAAIDHGAALVNDISGLGYDAALGRVVAETGAGLVLMHMRGRPRQMYLEAVYRDVAAEVAAELGAAVDRARQAGVPREAIILDPGIGFAKRPEHSWEALARLHELSALDRPILVGPSRKSFLKAALGDTEPGDRDWGTAATVCAAILAGAHIVRVHAAGPMVQVARATDHLRQFGRVT